MNSFPHDSVNHDRLYSANDFRQFFTPLVSNGVFADPASGCSVTTMSGNTVSIAAGRCFINGTIGNSDGTETVTLDDGDEYYDRIDLVALRLDLTSRDIHVQVIKGIPATTPIYPEYLRTGLKHDLVVAAIIVPKNSTSISQSNITDLRFNATYCGIVASIVNVTDTTELFAQYQNAWELLIAGFSGDEEDIITAFNKLNSDRVAYYSVQVSVSDWVADADGGYSCIKTVDGLLTTDKKISDVVLSTDRDAALLQLLAWECLCDGNIIITEDNTVKLWCYNNLPTVTLTVGLQVIR